MHPSQQVCLPMRLYVRDGDKDGGHTKDHMVRKAEFIRQQQKSVVPEERGVLWKITASVQMKN